MKGNSCLSGSNFLRPLLIRLLISLILFAALSGCSKSDSNKRPALNYVENEFAYFETFQGFCGFDYQLFFIRSLFLELYFWGDEIVDIDPRTGFNSLGSYFNYLLSDDLVDPIASPGRLKDPWSGVAATGAFNNALTLGLETSFGFRMTSSQTFGDGDVHVAFVVANSNADGVVQRGDQILEVNGLPLSSGTRQDALDFLYPYSIGESVELLVQPVIGAQTTVNLSSQAVLFPAVENTQTISAPISGSPTAATVGYLQFNDHTDASADDLISAFQDFSDDNIDELVIDVRYNGGGYTYIANLLTSMIAPASLKADPQYFARINIPNVNADRSQFPENEEVEFIESFNGNAIPELELNRVFVLTGNETCSASELVMNSLRGIGVEVVQIGDTTCGKPYGFYGIPNCGYTYLPVAFKSFSYNNSLDYDLGFTTQSTTTNLDIELNGCQVDDDFSKSLGDPTEARFAAALGYIFDGSCPVSAATITSTASESRTNGSASFNQRNSHRSNMIWRNPRMVKGLHAK